MAGTIVSIITQQEAAFRPRRFADSLAFPKPLFAIEIGSPKRSLYGGMEASDVKRLKDWDEESSRSKKWPPLRMLCDLSLDTQILKEIFAKRLDSTAKTELTYEIVEKRNIAVSRVCKIVNPARPQYYYGIKKRRSQMVV